MAIDRFSERAKTWDTPRKVAMTNAFVQKIKEKGIIHATSDVVEIGCGTGLVGLQFAGACSHLTMADTSEGMLLVLQDKISERNMQHISIVHGGIEKVETEASVLLIFMALHHIEDLEEFTNQARRILRAGGTLVVGDLYAEDGSFHREFTVPHNGFAPTHLTAWLSDAGFGHIEIEPLFTVTKKERDYELFILTANKQ